VFLTLLGPLIVGLA